ncbi:MAG: isoprenylcysteine carboxylmethyltransferase family protein [Sedimentisphaerales bacterium]
MDNAQNDIKKKPSYPRMVIRAFVGIVLAWVAVFVLAGRLNYWQGWLVIVMYLVLMVTFTARFAKNNKELIQERFKPGPGVKWWDKIFLALYVPLAVSIILIAALDAGRFHWSSELPIFLYPLAFVLTLLSYCGVLWAMLTNKFFSSRVRIQTDRGHYVITEGPYRFVRHPGYAGIIVLLPAMALLLGSLYALIPAAVTIVLIIIRTYLEDITLQKELPGYSDYTKKTKYRLLPGLW